MRVAPGQAVTFMVYEKVKNLIVKHGIVAVPVSYEE